MQGRTATSPFAPLTGPLSGLTKLMTGSAGAISDSSVDWSFGGSYEKMQLPVGNRTVTNPPPCNPPTAKDRISEATDLR